MESIKFFLLLTNAVPINDMAYRNSCNYSALIPLLSVRTPKFAFSWLLNYGGASVVGHRRPP